MKIYLFAWDIPEFKDLSREEARKLYSKYSGRILFHWKGWLGIGVIIPFLLLWDWMVRDIMPVVLGVTRTPESTETLLLLFWGFIAGLVGSQLITQAIRELYRRDVGL